MSELLALGLLAGLWWIPTFVGLAELHNRPGLRRVVVWRWTALLCVPVAGAALWFTRGRQQTS